MFEGAVPTFLTGPDGSSEFVGVARPSTFNVLGVNGTPLSPLGLARMTGDTARVDLILNEKRASTAGMVLGTAGGVSMLIAGALEVRGGEALLNSPAAASATALDAGSDRVRGGAALLVAGGLTTFFSQLQGVAVRVKQSYVASYWTGPELEVLLRNHNARLRADSGLTEQDESFADTPPLRVVPRLGVGFIGLDGSF